MLLDFGLLTPFFFLAFIFAYNPCLAISSKACSPVLPYQSDLYNSNKA